MSWERVKLSDCCESIFDGDHQAPPKSEVGVPFITISNINGNNIDFSNTMYVPIDYYEKLDLKRKAQIGDILYSVVGSFGIPVLIKNNKPFVFQRHIAILRPNKNVVESRFLYYVMLSRDFYMQADSVALGAAQRTVSLTALRNMIIDLPSMDIQDKIANILSAYDDLIENNQKQIKLLEEAAQRLYKEWFVDLRFPGYEDVEIVDGIPEGWKVKTISECLEMNIGGGWGKESIIGKNNVPGKVIRGTDINDIKSGDYSGIPLRYHTENDKNKRSLKANDIVFELSNGNINNIGRCILIDDFILENCGENTMCASFCKLMRPIDSLHAIILYREIQDMQISGEMLPLKKQGSNGINNFAFDDFLNHKLLIPKSEDILISIKNIMTKISYSQEQISLLKQARDCLLPKLMSGELEV